MPGGTCRDRERERARRKRRGEEGGRERSLEPNGALEKKRQEGRESAQKKGWMGKDGRFEATKCTRGSGRGREMEQKWVTEESSLVIAKSIHTIVCVSDSERQREKSRESKTPTANHHYSVPTSQSNASLVMSESIWQF